MSTAEAAAAPAADVGTNEKGNRMSAQSFKPGADAASRAPEKSDGDSGSGSGEGEEVVKTAHPPAAKKGFQFWAIIATLCVVGILSALENTVVVTSLPFIVEELQLRSNYIWVTNAFFLTSCVPSP